MDDHPLAPIDDIQGGEARLRHDDDEMDDDDELAGVWRAAHEADALYNSYHPRGNDRFK